MFRKKDSILHVWDGTFKQTPPLTAHAHSQLFVTRSRDAYMHIHGSRCVSSKKKSFFVLTLAVISTTHDNSTPPTRLHTSHFPTTCDWDTSSIHETHEEIYHCGPLADTTQNHWPSLTLLQNYLNLETWNETFQHDPVPRTGKRKHPVQTGRTGGRERIVKSLLSNRSWMTLCGAHRQTWHSVACP